MTRRDWTHKPLPMWEPKHKAWTRNADKIAKDNETLQSIPWAAVAPEGDIDIFENQRIFHDLDNSGEMVRGLMTASEAMEQGMAQGYTRGILAGNQAHDRWAAGTMWGGKDFRKYDDTILDFDNETEAFLQREAGSSKWNLAKPLHGEIPILELMDETPEDLFHRPAPEGWKVEGEGGALDVLKNADPRLYWIYLRELGGEEGLKNIVEDARNPYEFFYNLSAAMQINSMAKSIQVWQRQASGSEIAGEHAKAFVVGGIINDPDLLATVAASIALSFATGGVSLIGGAAMLASRANKYARRIDKLADWMGSISQAARVGQRYLPENLGPTLVKSHLMKEKYAKTSRIGQYGINRLADTAEGLVTEPLAEFFNQRRQISFGTMDEYNVGGIVQEGLIGAAISGPFHLNFIVGKAYSLGGAITSTLALPFTVPATALSKKGMLKTVNEYVTKTLRYADADYLKRAVRLTRASDSLKDKLREGLGVDDVSIMESSTEDPIYDDMFNALLNTLFEHGNMSEEKLLKALEEAADTLKLSNPDDWGKMDPGTFSALLSKIVVEQNGLEFTSNEDGTVDTTLGQVLAWQQHHLWVAERARAEGMSFSDYLKKIKEEGNHFDILPDMLKDAVAEDMGDDFETATNDAKYDKAVEVALDLKKKKMEELEKPLKAMEAVDESINEIIKDEGVKDTIPVENPATNPMDFANNSREKVDKAATSIRKQKKEAEQEIADAEAPGVDPKKKIKPARKKRLKTRIKKWQQALDKLEELRRDIDVELRGWLEASNVDSGIVELHQTMRDLKERVDKSTIALEKAGLRDIKDLTDLRFIFGVEINSLFEQELTDSEKAEVSEGKKRLRHVIGRRRIKTSELTPKAREALEKIVELLPEKSKAKDFISSILNGSQETLTINQVNQRIFNKVEDNIKLRKKKLYDSAVWDHHKKEVEAYNETLRDYRIKLARIYKLQTQKEMRMFDAVYFQQNLAKWEKRQTRTLDARQDVLLNNEDSAINSWEKEGRSTVTLEEFLGMLHELSPLRQSIEESLLDATEEESAVILSKEYTMKEVKKIAVREYDLAKKRIGNFRPGMSGNTKFPVRSRYIHRTYVDQVKDDEIFSVDFDPDYIVNNSNPGTSLEAKPAEGTGALISVAGNEIQLNENTKIIMDEKGNPKVYYSAQNTILDRDAWDPDTDKEMQELTIAHEKARDAHERAVRDRDDGTRSTKVIQNEINELNNLAGDYSPALYQKKREVENHSKILEDLTESLRYVVENESFDFTEADAKEIINKAKEVSRGNLTIQEFFKSFEERELTNPIPHRVSDWLTDARELSKAGMGFKNNLTGETTTVEIVETKEAQKEREDKIRNLKLEIWNHGKVIEGLRTEEFRAKERMGQYFETRRVYQPIDWRSEGRTMGRTGDKRGGAFVTDKRHHAESYAGQKEGDTIAEIAVITQGDPIVIDMGGGIYNQDIEIEVLTKALPKDFIDWYIARYPNSPLAQEKTEGLSKLDIDVLTSELSRWHREMKKAGEDTSNMANVVMFKNVRDWGDSTFMKPPEGSEFELADTVYVVNEEYIVDSDKAVVTPTTRTPDTITKKQTDQRTSVENKENVSPEVLLANIETALERGLITDVQAKYLINLAERVSKGEMTLQEFNSYVEANINPDAVITEPPIRNWLQNAHELSVAGVTFDNRLTGETRVETSRDQEIIDTTTDLYTTVELEAKKKAEIVTIAKEMKLAGKLGITASALGRKKKADIIELIIQNQKAPAMAKLEFTRTLQQDVGSWNEFLANLSALRGTEVNSNPNGIAAFRIFSSMPEYFWDMGLGVHIIFRDAIIGENKNLDDVSLGSMVHTLRFDLDKVVGIARRWRDRGLAQLEGWQKESLETVLDSLEEDLLKEGDSSSAHNLFRTLEFVKGVEAALIPFNRDMYGIKGYILTVNTDTGFPDADHFIPKELYQSEQDLRYRNAVRESIEKRMLWYVENNRIGHITRIAERFGITATEENWGGTARKLGNIIVERIGEVDSSWTIENFGNGELGWDAADHVGAALVDFLGGREQPGVQPLTAVENRTGHHTVIGSEHSLIQGEPVQVALPVEGDLNMAMPVPLWRMASIVSNYKHRSRIKYFLNKDKFTSEELEALEEWKRNKTFIDDPDPTGEELPVFIFPQFIGGHIKGRPMDRDDMKMVALELMTDIPRISNSFLQDQVRVSKGMPLAFKSGTVTLTDGSTVEANLYQGMLGHGDDFIVPFNRIGEILAIENMSPMFAGLTEASLAAQQRFLGKFRKAWELANPGKEWNVSYALSTSNDSDRNASGFYEMKLLSLAGDSKSRIKVDMGDGTTKEYTPQELIQDIREGVLDSQFTTKEKDDFYLKTGIHIIQSIKGGIEELGSFNHVFGFASNFETNEQWAEGISLATEADRANNNDDTESMEDLEEKVAVVDRITKTLMTKYGLSYDDKLTGKLKSLRELFKINTMRRVYGGGEKNYQLEFVEQPNGKGKLALAAIEKAFGLKFTAEEVDTLGSVIFGYGTVNMNKILIDEAVGMTGPVKAKALQYVSIEPQDQPLVEEWQRTLNAVAILEGKTKKEMGAAVRKELSKIETNRRLLDAKIDQIAKYEGLQGRDAVMKKQVYMQRITKAKEYLNELEAKGKELKPGSPEWEVYTKILQPHDQLLATDLGYFRAVNIMNSSQYRLNMDRIQQVSRDFGFKNFDVDDFMGLENRAFFHLMLPTATSYRAYDVLTEYGLNPQGMSLERVARIGDIEVEGTVYESFEDYMERRKELHIREGRDWNEEAYREELRIFLQADDAADRFGIQELQEGMFDNMTPDEIDAELEQMLTMQEMLTWSTYDKPPASVFSDYTEESSASELLSNVIREWYSASENRHLTLPEEMALEAEEWEKDGISSKILKIRSKAGGIVNPQVAKASGGVFTLSPYHITEEVGLNKKDPERSLVVVNTSNPKGVQAMAPKYKSVPFHNKGILALQRKYLQEEMDTVMSPIDNIREHANTEEHGMFAWDGDKTRGVEVGWVAPWKRKSLPEPRRNLKNEFDVEDDMAGRDASRLMNRIHSWAKERGVEDQLKQDRRAYPFFFVIMEIENARVELLNKGPRIRNEDEELAYRNQWLMALHNVTQLSRDIKYGSIKGRSLEEKALELAIVNPPGEDMNWLDILTSVVSESNPNGILFHPTLLNDALNFGEVPGENMITSFDVDGTSVMGDFEFNALQLDARAVQAADFQKYLAAIIYTEYIGKALFDYKVDGEFIYRKDDIWKDPAKWESHVVDPEHRVDLINIAKQMVTEESQSLIFDVSIEGSVYKNAEGVEQIRIVFNQETGHSERNKTTISHIQRNTQGKAGFGMLVGGNTTLAGKKATIGISPTAALNMFAMLENARLFSRIGYSQHMNKAIGVKMSKDGRKVVAVPIQDAIKEAMGYTARPIREAGIARSESLQRLAGGTELETTTDPRSHILGRDVTVVDLDHYTLPRHEGGQHMTTAWVESFISPVMKYVTAIEDAGFTDMSMEAAELRKWVSLARQGDKLGIAVIMHTTLLLENPKNKNANEEIRGVFFDNNRFGDVYNEAFEIGFSLFRRLATLNSEDKFQRDTPWYWAARDFFFRSEESTDPLGDFKADLKEKGLWEAADEYIRNEYMETNKKAPTEEMYEELRNRWAERAYYTAAGQEINIAEARAAMDMDMMNNQYNQKLDMDLVKDSRNFNNMQKLAERLDNGDISRVNRNIEDLESRGFIDNRQARLIRAIVLRAFRQNPVIIQDFSFNIDNRVTTAAGAFKQGTKFFIRVGDQVKTLGTDKLDVVQLFAHELAHIGRLKFIKDNGGDWMKFESLYHSDAGRSLLRKLITAWHGGRWTANAEAEYNKYTENAEEFIAGLGQYYLLKDILPAVSDLNQQEMTVLDKAREIVERVFKYVEQIFGNVAGVWVNVSREDSKLMTEVNILMDRLLGWDSVAQEALGVQLGNQDQELNWANRFDERKPVEYTMDDGTYETKVRRFETLYAKSENTALTNNEQQEMVALDEQLNADNDDQYSMFSGSRREYFTYKMSALKKFSRKVEKGAVYLDIEAMLESGGENSMTFAQDMEFAAALHYVTIQLEKTFGNAISRGAGEMANKVSAMLSTVGGMRDSKHSGSLRNKAVDLMVGRTGAGHTWNAGHIMPVWLTNLLNDQIATVAGHYTNVKGTPSVQRVLDELAIFSQRVMADYRTIENIMNPVMAKVFGEGKITEAQAEKDMNELNAQIALRADNKEHEFAFTPSLKNSLDSLSDKKRNKIMTAMEDIANTFGFFLRRHTEDGIKLGIYSKEFRGIIPYKLSKEINDPDNAGSFNDEMSTLISNRILSEGDMGRIDPVTLFGSGLIPTIHDAGSMVKELRQIEKDKPEYFDWLIKHILLTDEPKLRGDLPELSVRRSSFMVNLERHETRTDMVRKARLGIRKLYQDMARGETTWTTFGKMKGKDSMYNKYIEHAKDPSDNSRRYNKLFAAGLHYFIPQYIAYNPRHKLSTTEMEINKGTSTGVHVHNLVNRASGGQYLPNDNWVIPQIKEAANNHTIRKHLVLHPVTLIEDFRKGLADEIGEKKMLADNYGIFATYRDVINLFDRVISKPGTNLRNYDGSIMDKQTVKDLRQSASILKEKHDHIRGIQRYSDNPSAFETKLLNMAPSVTKIAFGGNLMLATTVVEGMMNVLQEGFGKGNLKAVMRGIFNPILALKENQREEVVNDLIHLVEALTQGYIPEYEKPSSHAENTFMENTAKRWGGQMMRPAQYIMKNIAVTRAISLRDFITKNLKNDKLLKLVKAIEKDPLKTPDDLKARMRSVGLSHYAHEMTISYLLRGGFLEPGKFAALVEMVPLEGRYSPFAMYDSLSKEMSSTDPRYNTRLDVIAGLKSIEKAYIEEVIVTPNAFDVYTGGGTIDTIWEIFMRYPILFVSQHVFRKGSRLHPVRYALGLVGMMMLDMLYMNLLKIAGGAKIEDVLEDWEANPVTNAAHFMTRLPILGRYSGIIAQLVYQGTAGKYGQQAGGFVALGAVSNMFSGGVKATKGWAMDEEHKWQDTINFLRIMPMMGDSIVRMGIYAGLGNNIDRRAYRNAAGGSTSRSRGANSVAGHYGIAYKDMMNTWESWMGDLITEMSPDEPMKWSDYQGPKDLDLPGMNQTPLAPPSQPVGSPVQASPKKDVVSAILDQKPAQAPSGLL